MKKILVVEDDKFLSQAYNVKLTKAGFEVILAMDGQEAMKVIQTNKPDLIVLDLIMPVKDGFSVLEDIKKEPKYQKIPVIIASNLGQTEDVNKGMNLGAVDYFIKSDLSLENLIKKINSVLKS